MKSKKEPTTSIRCSVSTAESLRKVSERTGITVTWITDAAIAEWMARHAGLKTVAGAKNE